MAENNDPVILTFGGGVNARRRPTDIDINECVEGENFDLDYQFLALTRRNPFDLLGTATNAGRINGFAQRISQSGAVSTLVQAGDTVYSWDFSTTFTSVGTVSSAARLRGPRNHNFTLDEYVIITDLAKQETVKKWDGTTLSNLAHNLGGSFYAKFCHVHKERAFFGNVQSGTDTPHVLLGSQISDAETLTISDRPSSSLGLDAPFYIPTPDLRPINGLVGAFGEFLIGTHRGRLHALTGESSFDFDIIPFYEGSAVSGDEAMTLVGNDVALGSPGRIESLSGTVNFGDVETNDLSIWISPKVEDVYEWRIVYDAARQRVLCFPINQSAVWVLHKSLFNPLVSESFSPWSKWTTSHNLDFTPTTVMSLIHPVSFKDVVCMGDSLGNIYVLDGEGGQDGGSADLTVTRTSKLIRAPEDQVFDISGYINYRKEFAASVTLSFLFGGVHTPDQDITISLPASGDIGVYNDSVYYGGDSYYGSEFTSRIHRRDFGPAGQSSHFQVKATVAGQADIQIEEIGLRFRSAQT